MIKLDHLTLPVRDHARAREWYVRTLGLRVEFEVPVRLWDETTMSEKPAAPAGQA